MTDPYTFIRIESGAAVNECLWTDLRLWFNTDDGIGIYNNGDMARCKIITPYFESFVTSPSNITAIEIASTATSAPYFIGRPIFSPEAKFTETISNSGNKNMHGLVSYTRHNSATISPSATANTYGTTVTETFNGMDVSGAPRVFVLISGSFGGGETVTLEIKTENIDGFERASPLTKTFTATTTGTELSATEYFSLIEPEFPGVLKQMEYRLKSSINNSQVTALVVVMF